MIVGNLPPITSLRYCCNCAMPRRGRFKTWKPLEPCWTDDRARTMWLTSSRAVHSMFWTTRLARERAIANLRKRLTLDELQPGLFDLRAAQAWIDEQERRHLAIRESTWFATTAMRAATLVTGSPRIALVLLTR